jgi:hypothetical protein
VEKHTETPKIAGLTLFTPQKSDPKMLLSLAVLRRPACITSIKKIASGQALWEPQECTAQQ